MTRSTTQRSLAVLATLLLLTGCSASRDASDPTAADEPSPIRVLMMTATHGERHEDAIAASKEVMTDVDADGEFAIEISEDLNDLTSDYLDDFDILLFANSTLRTAGDFSPSEMEASYDPMDGSWGHFDVVYESPQGTGEGELAIWGEPGALSGFVQAADDPEPTELSSVHVEGDSIFAAWPGGNAGSVEIRAALIGEELSGNVHLGNQIMPLSGTRTGPDVDENVGPALDSAHRAAILEFVRSGKGLVVVHAGLDALHDWHGYRELVGGGLADSEPWIQQARVVVEDPENPAVSHFGASFEIEDGFYMLDANPRWNSRVLASLQTDGLVEDNAPADRTRNDYPVSWVRRADDGRVFVTKLGHSAETWRNANFQEHLLQGLRMVAGTVDASFGGYRVKEVIAPDVWPDDISIDERGNVWIAELRGKIHRYDAESGQTSLIAEIPTTDPTGIEHGVYGIETDPNFYSGEPYVYVFYAEQHTFLNTLSRFEYRDGQLDLSSEHKILIVPTEPQCCHQAGDLEWGPDGTLYVSTGDTGYSGTRPTWEISEERIDAFMERHDLSDYHWSRIVDSERTSQSLSDLRGKILRINKDGSIPKDNPFYGEPGVRWEIFAYGLRNPYRFKVDHETGAVYIGVVGPDAQYDYDEYNVAYGGENFGWPRSIGTLFYNEWTSDMIENYVPPMWEYTYQTGSRSATVGPLYRFEGDGAFPEFLQGKVFVYDWSRRWIKYGEMVDGTFVNDRESDYRTPPYGVEIPATRLTNVRLFDQLTLTTPISMELGPDGSIYVAEYDGFWDPGENAQVTRYRWVDDE